MNFLHAPQYVIMMKTKYIILKNSMIILMFLLCRLVVTIIIVIIKIRYYIDDHIADNVTSMAIICCRKLFSSWSVSVIPQPM